VPVSPASGLRQETDVSGPLPPGQYPTCDFPVLSAGPAPKTDLGRWTFSLTGEIEPVRRWTWAEFLALPSEAVTTDVHCVTHWSKLDTVWEGVSLDTLLDGVETSPDHVVASCDGG
jgi:DMSO/TMAO reductase YedYZ molybdopterin-dependent catalytic subunit